ncbi:hypothetical protein [Streptomyces sp. NPDC088727]|uniref:hypothetical protein n=1 Tax=Streptomyces sp. NPDC088727 TaxID=3365875 RepID=UPI0037F46D81
MVWKEGNGAYRLSPLIAGFRTPAEQLQAIGAMDDDDRFDHSDFQERYQQQIEAYEEEKLAKAAERQRRLEPPIDLAARRRTSVSSLTEAALRPPVRRSFSRAGHVRLGRYIASLRGKAQVRRPARAFRGWSSARRAPEGRPTQYE